MKFYAWVFMVALLGATNVQAEEGAKPPVLTLTEALALIGGEGDFKPKEVVGHLGFGSEYMDPFLIRARVTEHLSEHSAEALHVVPLLGDGIGAELLRAKEFGQLKEHGKVAVIVDSGNLGSVDGYQNRADYIISVPTGGISNVFTELILKAAKTQSHAVDVYAAEGGRIATDALFRIPAAAYYRLEEADAAIRIHADLNFNPKNFIDEQGHLAATAALKMAEELKLISSHVQFEFTTHQEAEIGRQLIGGASDKNWVDIDLTEPFTYRQRLRDFDAGLLHSQGSGYIDLFDGESFIAIPSEESVEFYLLYTADHAEDMEQVKFIINLSINEEHVEASELHGQVIDIGFGREAIVFSMSNKDLGIDASSKAPILIDLEYRFNGWPSKSIVKSTVAYSAAAEVALVAADSRLRLLQAQLYAAQETLLALSKGDVREGRYVTAYNLSDKKKRIAYLHAAEAALKGQHRETSA